MASNRLTRWLWNQAIALDQWGNALTGGSPDETISARAGRLKTRMRGWRWVAALLDWWDPGHTDDAVKSEQERRHLPPEYRP